MSNDASKLIQKDQEKETGAANPPAAKAAAAAAPSKPASAAKERRAFEVAGTVSLGRRKGVADIRKQGETVYEDELDPEMLQYLVSHGQIIDNNAPVAPTQADAALAFRHLVEVAMQTGALLLRGSEYRLAGEDDTTFRGFAELRKGVSIEKLKAAIVAKVNG